MLIYIYDLQILGALAADDEDMPGEGIDAKDRGHLDRETIEAIAHADGTIRQVHPRAPGQPGSRQAPQHRQHATERPIIDGRIHPTRRGARHVDLDDARSLIPVAPQSGRLASPRYRTRRRGHK